MWDWLSERMSRSDPSDIVYEDYPDCHQAKRLLAICCELEEGLLQSCGATTTRKRLFRWLFDDSIGNIHYMREDLMRRYKCEQVWVESFDGKKIDCLFLTTHPEAPTVLFCNPNAGFYEFAFYQSEWFEFYYRRGINLMYWNYRGFGRSQGNPTLNKICRDGEEIVRYLRDVKNVKILAVHGESLGGSVACHLANKCGANFLFADRTFASLSQAAYYNFGRCAYIGFKASRKEDIDVAWNFLEAKCFKVLSCDPKDLMINDLGSLKAGVARELLYPGFPKTHILLLEHMQAFFKSLSRVQGLISQLGNINRDNTRVTNKYQPLQEDLGLFENEKFKETIMKLKLLLNGIEAGGVTLLGCFRSKMPETALVNWVMILDVWGSSTVVPRSSPLQIAAETLKNIVRELELLMDVVEIKKEIQDIHLALNAVKTHLDGRLDFSDTRSLSTSQEFKLEVDYDRAGFLLPISCGHGGPFSNQEKFYYEQYLAKALKL
jgi:alpha/beta superfamily hydrolase